MISLSMNLGLINMHDDERVALESAIMTLSDAVIALHNYRLCPLKADFCIPCKALRNTGFIRSGIEAKLGDERRRINAEG